MRSALLLKTTRYVVRPPPHFFSSLISSVSLWLVTPLLLSTVGEGSMFSGCLSAPFLCLFVHPSGQILLLRFLMNGLSSLDETYNEYSLPLLMTSLCSRGQRSKIEVTASMSKAFTSTPGCHSSSSSFCYFVCVYSRVMMTFGWLPWWC